MGSGKFSMSKKWMTVHTMWKIQPINGDLGKTMHEIARQH